MGRGLLAVGVMGLVLALGAGEARADVVGPPPDDCPEGSEGATCHGGPFCRARGCMSDSDCDTGTTCKELPLCTGKIGCAGNIPPDADPNDFTQDKIEGPCPNGNECTAGSTCVKQKVCVGDGGSSSSSSGSDGGCACGEARGAATGAGLGAVAFGIGAVVLASARRRQGRASRQRRA